ncbi:MAG TPA: OmpA family protein [Steroidobacteraceae bacterium]|jgi:outer membrane protein OmpA-like peptidoglycan-associated protein|nr:OmpA family protein [Steroidobacteraceae bacterium]
MKAAYSKIIWTVGLVGLSTAALADAPKTKPPPQEPVGFVTGAVIGGFAAGPIGAVVGAGLGTWLGNRVHRAGEARKAEAQVAALKSDKTELEAKTTALEAKSSELETARSDLEETNRALTARLDQLAHSVEAAQAVKDDAAREEAAKVLDGLEGDILFRTGSADIPEETSHEIESLADVLAKSPALTVRLDGYADPRGTVEGNMKLSEARANAVRDLLLAAGVREDALEVNAYGKSRSTADDSDGYALERRVRLTLQAAAPAPVAQGGTSAGMPAAEALEKTSVTAAATTPPTATDQKGGDK